jgi:hypothetical protein
MSSMLWTNSTVPKQSPKGRERDSRSIEPGLARSCSGASPGHTERGDGWPLPPWWVSLTRFGMLFLDELPIYGAQACHGPPDRQRGSVGRVVRSRAWLPGGQLSAPDGR